MGTKTLIAALLLAAPNGAQALRTPAAVGLSKEIDVTLLETVRLPAVKEYLLQHGAEGLTLSDACQGDMKQLAVDPGYITATVALEKDDALVGAWAGKQCYGAAEPCDTSIGKGACCTTDATDEWSKHTDDVTAVVTAAAKALPAADASSDVTWLDLDILLGGDSAGYIIEETLKHLTPIYLPSTCLNDADLSEILSDANKSCKAASANTDKCTFTVSA